MDSIVERKSRSPLRKKEKSKKPGHRSRRRAFFFSFFLLVILPITCRYLDTILTDTSVCQTKIYTRSGSIASFEADVLSGTISTGFWYLFYPTLLKNQGVIIDCPEDKISITTSGLMYPLDIIFISNGRIVKLWKNAQPNSGSIHADHIDQVLDLPSGSIKAHDIQVDDIVTFDNYQIPDEAVYKKKPFWNVFWYLFRYLKK